MGVRSWRASALVAVALAIAGAFAPGASAYDDDEHLLPKGSFPTRHRSSEGEVGRGPWPVTVFMGGLKVGTEDLSRAFPAWVDVDGPAPRVLEGVVAAGEEGGYPGPHVSREEFPTTHYTHDMTFHVRPDRAYSDLLGVQVFPDGHEGFEDLMEVEWESGLCADNLGNPMAGPNHRGDSAGFFSAGHRRGMPLTHWPTLGARVHVEGHWIWDRGHPPADTEIHPPRLMAITRHLPAVLRVLADAHGHAPLRPVLATRVDVFASGDGGALWNNRTGVPAFVQRVAMGTHDYTWEVHPILPAPGPNAKLRAAWLPRPGDSFGARPALAPLAGDRPGFRVTLPWQSAHVSDVAVFDRTLYLYWDQGDGVPAGYGAKAFRVTLDRFDWAKSQDVGPGQFRVFVEAGGTWWSANELQPVRDVLNQGLGHADRGNRFPIARSVDVVVPPGDRFRVHADGWEADGVDTVFGHLWDPCCPRTPESAAWLNANLFTFDVFARGGRDDPAGEVNHYFGARDAAGAHADVASGWVQHDVFVMQDGDPNGTYTLRYHITPLDWRKVDAPRGWSDASVAGR